RPAVPPETPGPTVKMARRVPSLGRTLARLLILLPLVHQMFVPSKRMEAPPPPNSPTRVPSRARTFSKTLAAVDIQVLAPSKAIDPGPADKGPKFPSTAPSLGRTLNTRSVVVAQMLAPSKITSTALVTLLKFVVRFAGYQCKMAICLGFFVELVTPPCADATAHVHESASRARTI